VTAADARGAEADRAACVPAPDPHLGTLIRRRRRSARLSLRQLAERASVSNPYLSQVERGLHEPSLRVLRAIARGLDVAPEVLLAEAGLLARRWADGSEGTVAGVEAAIALDGDLDEGQKAALTGVYRCFVAARRRPDAVAG